jgi:hypothetical protein
MARWMELLFKGRETNRYCPGSNKKREEFGSRQKYGSVPHRPRRGTVASARPLEEEPMKDESDEDRGELDGAARDLKKSSKWRMGREGVPQHPNPRVAVL